MTPGDDADARYERASADIVLPLSEDEVALLLEALDSHAYWQLSDEVYRRDGYVQTPGSDDPDTVAMLGHVSDLERKLSAALREHDSGDHPDADRPPGTSGSWGEA